MKKQLLLLMPMLLVATSCAPKPAQSSEEDIFPDAQYSVNYVPGADGTGVITDAIGREVTIKPGSYQKVVCIGAGALRLYSYVGDMNLLCGVEDIENTDADGRPAIFDNVARPYFMANNELFKTLPSCGKGGPQAQAAEAEKIATCDPDIVISEYEDVEKEDALQEQLGVPVITLRYGSAGLINNTLYGTLAMLGKIFGKEARAKEVIDYHHASLKAVYDRTKTVENRKRAYICGLGNWGTTNQYMTAQNYDAFNVAHVDNVVTGLPKDGVQAIEEETFVALSDKMDIMFFDAAAVKNIRKAPYDFSICKAFETGEVYLQMAYNVYYSNVETALINTWFIAKSVYPSLFEDVSIEAVANEVTAKFNGKALYDEIKALPQSYGGYQKIANPTEFFNA